MNFLSELVYFFSPKKSTELIRKLLKKNPRWARGHLILADCVDDNRVREVSLKAAQALRASDNIRP